LAKLSAAGLFLQPRSQHGAEVHPVLKETYGRRRRYGRHGSCRTTFERGTARQAFAVPYFS